MLRCSRSDAEDDERAEDGACGEEESVELEEDEDADEEEENEDGNDDSDGYEEEERTGDSESAALFLVDIMVRVREDRSMLCSMSKTVPSLWSCVIGGAAELEGGRDTEATSILPCI